MGIYHIFQGISMLQLTSPLKQFCPRYICGKPIQHIMNKMNINHFQCKNHKLCKGKQPPISFPQNKRVSFQ